MKMAAQPKKQAMFGLSTPADLFAKLLRDFEKLQASPDGIDPAFNFFITAHSLVDWTWSHETKDQRTQRVAQDSLLSVVCHVANGSKHLMLYQSVQPVLQSGHRMQRRPGGGGLGLIGLPPRRKYEKRLVLTIESSYAQGIGCPETVRALDLASKVVQYWQQHFN